MPAPYPTYQVGDVVQILSEEEVLSHPVDVLGNFILVPFHHGAGNSFHKDKLPTCGCLAVITGISKGCIEDLYRLTPLLAKDKTVFPWDSWFFSASEFYPFIVLQVSTPSMSFDDLLKGATPQ